MRITKAIGLKLANKYNVDLDVVPFEEFLMGLKIELEHGNRVSALTNITFNDLDMTCKIALAHLKEDPRYYYHLAKLESRREKYWSTKKKPNIFKN